MSAGNDTINAIKSANQFGLMKNQTVAPQFMFIQDVHSLGLKTAQGLTFATAFYWDRTPETRATSLFMRYAILVLVALIFVFPLVLLLPMGLFPFDPKVVRYALPLAAAGWAVALFQLLLVHGVIPESAEPCRVGVSCKDVQVEWLGFVSIPLLSFVAFTVMCALLVGAHRRSHR